MNPAFYERAIRRIWRLTFAVILTGTAVWLVRQGWRPGIGFLMGAALSLLNFQGLVMLAQALGGSKNSGLKAAILIVLRYAIIGVALYVILKLLGFAPLPVLSGLLAPFGAAILEILYELIFPISE
jgi:hypothetical protein